MDKGRVKGPLHKIAGFPRLALERLIHRMASELKKELDQELGKAVEVYSRKMRPFVLSGHFAELRRGTQLRELHLTEMFGGIEDVMVPIGAVSEETDYYNMMHTLYVVAIARHLGSRRIFEFGTWIGKTAYYLACNADDAQVITLDMPPGDEGTKIGHDLGLWFRDSDRRHQITQILTNSRAFDPTPYQGQMDLIFVDGDHTHEGVKSDTENAFKMLAPGGVIIWDDYDPKVPEVAEYIREFTQDQPLFWIKNTCLLVHMDGVDPLTFEARPRRFTRLTRKVLQRVPMAPRTEPESV